jgi:DNA-binding PadR family transcriptional regulator
LTDPIILILASLAAGDKHGYAIMEDVETFAGVRLGPGTLYGAITRMEERGLIRPVESSDRRQPYAITPPGRKRLEEAVAALSRISAAVAERLGPA